MSIARHTLITTAGAFATVAVTVVTVPAYLHLIGQERYGVLAIVWTILAYFGLVEISSGALVQRIASRDTRASERIELYWAAFATNATLGLVAAAILWCSFDFIVGKMSFSTSQVEDELLAAAPIIATLPLLLAVRSVNSSVLMAVERFQAATALGTSEAIGAAVMPLAVAHFISPHLVWLLGSILIIRIAFAMASFFVMRSSLPGFGFRPIRIDHVRGLMSFGLWAAMIAIVGPMLGVFDRFLIGNIAGLQQLPYYTVPQNAYQILVHLPRALGAVLFPRFSSLGDESQTIALGVRATDATNIVMTPLCVVGILLIEPVLRIWISVDFALHASSVAEVFLPGVWVASQIRITMNMLFARNRPDLVVKTYLLELPVYAALLFWLIHSYGMMGAAIASVVRFGVDSIVFGHFCGLLPALARQAFWSVPMMALAILIAQCFPVEDPLRWIASLVLAILAVVWSALFMPPQLVRVAHRLPGLRFIPLGIMKQES